MKHIVISTDEDPGLRIESFAVIIYVVFPQTKLYYKAASILVVSSLIFFI